MKVSKVPNYSSLDYLDSMFIFRFLYVYSFIQYSIL